MTQVGGREGVVQVSNFYDVIHGCILKSSIFGQVGVEERKQLKSSFILSAIILVEPKF